MAQAPLVFLSVFSLLQQATPAMVHPGILVTKPMLERIRANVAAKTEPTYSAFQQIITPSMDHAVWLGNLSYQPHPQKLWDVNKTLSPGTRWLSDKLDSLAAFTHALLWYITEDERHAMKASEIMDAWSAVLTRPVWAADALEAAWSGTEWARAAEIIKHTSEVWPEPRVRRFEAMLQDIYLPLVNEGASTNGNIALVMSEAALHIGVFTDNQTTVDKAVALWRHQVAAYLYVSSDGRIPKRPPPQRYLARTAPTCGPNCTDAQMVTFWHGNSEFLGHDGIAQETCRDLGHTEMLLSTLANFAETAYHQGIDLYHENMHRIISGAEFHSTLYENAPASIAQKWPPWLCGVGRCTGIHCAPTNGSTFEIIHHHFVHRLNMSLPNTTALLKYGKMRPTGCFDQLCWETLTHGDAL